jgi:hypothetical protein
MVHRLRGSTDVSEKGQGESGASLGAAAGAAAGAVAGAATGATGEIAGGGGERAGQTRPLEYGQGLVTFEPQIEPARQVADVEVDTDIGAKSDFELDADSQSVDASPRGADPLP